MTSKVLQRQQGATLIEILITVLVLSVGLLGLGATQMLSLKNGNNSNQTYFANLAAYDIAERMRINPLAVEAGLYEAADVDDTQAVQECTLACSSAELANMDLYEWGQALSANLPGGKGTIELDDETATITVSWKGQHTGADTGSADGGAEDKTFIVVVEL